MSIVCLIAVFFSVHSFARAQQLDAEQLSAAVAVATSFNMTRIYPPPYACPSNITASHFFHCDDGANGDSASRDIVSLRLFALGKDFVHGALLVHRLAPLTALTQLEIRGVRDLRLQPLNEPTLLPNLEALIITDSTAADANWQRIFNQRWRMCRVLADGDAGPNCISCAASTPQAAASNCTISPFGTSCAPECSGNATPAPQNYIVLSFPVVVGIVFVMITAAVAVACLCVVCYYRRCYNHPRPSKRRCKQQEQTPVFLPPPPPAPAQPNPAPAATEITLAEDKQVFSSSEYSSLPALGKWRYERVGDSFPCDMQLYEDMSVSDNDGEIQLKQD